MTKKVSDSQVAGIKAHAEAKNKETIDKVNKAIDKLKRKNKPINFETVCKEAGVSRATLYNNAQLKERILSLMQTNIPEAKKAEYIESYEEAYIEEILRKELEPYPIDATPEEKAKWTRSLISLISQYKIDHPDFKEMAQKHALDTAALIRKENKTEN